MAKKNENQNTNTNANTNTTTTLKTPVDVQRQKIRTLIANIYDQQKTRIAVGNHIVASFNIQMGQAPSTSQNDLDTQTKAVLDQLRAEYKKITDAYVNKSYICTKDSKAKGHEETITVKLAKNASIDKIIQQMNANADADVKMIQSQLDYDTMRAYATLCEAEEVETRVLDKIVKQHPLWDAFFKDVKGCGTLMAAVCIAYFDIDKARHVSSFWRYAGLDTVPVTNDDGTVIREGRAAKHAKFTQVEYVDKDGNTKTKNSLGYNPFVKTKLVGVLADCMLKAGLRSEKNPDGSAKLDKDGKKIRYALPDAKYVEVYLDYLSRLNNRPDTKDFSDMHKHRMATRYMIKQFLRDLWTIWRSSAGYDITEPYEVAKLGMKPHKYNQAQHELANK